MPKGPKGEKRPADVIGNTVKVMRIATGEEVEVEFKTDQRLRTGGKKGGQNRADTLSAEQRSEIARLAAEARWKKG
jgi:hypothetical protein